MNGLRLVVLALLAAASVHALPKLDADESMKQIMASMKNKLPSDSEETDALISKFSSMLDSVEFDLDDLKNLDEAETGEIGPNFNSKQFLAMIKRVSKSSWQKRCKKISGDDNAYDKAIAAGETFVTCIENWGGVEEIKKSFNRSMEAQEYTPLYKAVCPARSGFFECTDKYIDSISSCYFQKEMDLVHKLDRMNKNLLNAFCAHEADDFALFELEGEGMKCVHQSMTELRTCSNKALYAFTERFLAKWIENEHFDYRFDAEDCKAYDEIKSCFVSSVENCTYPKVKDFFASFFQIIRDETSCSKL